ncbi:MAG: hypothetical protein ACK5QT_07820 [Oligoflexia bacterium]
MKIVKRAVDPLDLFAMPEPAFKRRIESRFKSSLFAAAIATSPQLGPPSVPKDVLGCERTLIYRAKTLPCDSPIAADGEGLRMLMHDSPEALESLNRYQAQRRSRFGTAYAGTLGLLVAALAPRFSSDATTRNLLVAGGLSFTIGSFAFGKAQLAANERNLDRAIDHYNRKHPDDPIQLNRSP